MLSTRAGYRRKRPVTLGHATMGRPLNLNVLQGGRDLAAMQRLVGVPCALPNAHSTCNRSRKALHCACTFKATGLCSMDTL